ncbi:MAG: hypothetical protein IKW21_01290 [Lachnospiraceae bacterium]|nr:hypothetical protein [Lachnospiraceae bacterium]
MKRAKAKNSASKKYYISEKQLERIKQKVSKEITDKVCLLFLVAVIDETHLDEDGVCKLMERISRYTNNFEEHLFKMEDVRKSIEKSTGIVLKGWG